MVDWNTIISCDKCGAGNPSGTTQCVRCGSDMTQQRPGVQTLSPREMQVRIRAVEKLMRGDTVLRLRPRRKITSALLSVASFAYLALLIAGGAAIAALFWRQVSLLAIVTAVIGLMMYALSKYLDSSFAADMRMWMEDVPVRFSLKWGSTGEKRIDAAHLLQGSTLRSDIKALIQALSDPEAGGTVLNILKALSPQALPVLRTRLKRERNDFTRTDIQGIIAAIEERHSDFNTVDLSAGTDQAKHAVMQCPTCGKSQEGAVPEHGAFFCSCGAILHIEHYKVKHTQTAEPEN